MKHPRHWIAASFAFGMFVALFVVHTQAKLQTVLANYAVCEVASPKPSE